MTSTPDKNRDTHWMRRALHLAAQTTALTSPNPQVGCVLTRKDLVIGEGAHLYEQRDHAEIVALKQAAARGISPQGATAYVTLEPCSHHGRTPPCADALIAAGIARAVVATLDPNPLVSGRGMEKLRDAGIEVNLGVEQDQARRQNDAFAHFIQHRRPFVTLKAALSADGKLAPSPAHRTPEQPFWLTGPAARYEVQLLRHSADSILTGIGTVLADNPALTDRSGLLNPNLLPRRRPLLRVVLDTHLKTPLSSNLVRSANADLLILCGTHAPTSKIAALEAAGAEVRLLPDERGRLSLSAALDLLGERDLTSLLLETGSHLNASFLAHHLVDKVVLFYAPITLGAGAVPFAAGEISPKALERNLLHVERAELGPDTCITGLLHDPWKR